MNQKLTRILEEGKKLNLGVNYTNEDLIDIIKKMIQTAKDIYGKGTLEGSHKLMILLTGGGGDFNVILNVTFFFES